MHRSVDLIGRSENNIKWITDQYAKDLIFVDNSFQRKYVWLKKHQVKLIETILLGYSIPEIYLWETKTDPNTGDTIYSIVDGQQRIGAIVDFINNKYSLNSSYLDNENSDFANKRFSQLNDIDKSNIWSYRFFMRIMQKSVHRNDIVKTFLRLNATDKSLNPQELRNAKFDGLFLKTADDITKKGFWSKHNFFSTNDLRRMKDIDLVSSLLMFLRFGIEHELNQENINRAYDLFDEVYEEQTEDERAFTTIIEEIDRILKHSPSSIAFIRKKTHFYTLFVYMYEKLILDDVKIESGKIDIITQFIRAYDNDYYINDALKNKIEDIEKYRQYSWGGTTDKANRLARIRHFKLIVDGTI